jgi:hypothetical protein
MFENSLLSFFLRAGSGEELPAGPKKNGNKIANYKLYVFIKEKTEC